MEFKLVDDITKLQKDENILVFFKKTHVGSVYQPERGAFIKKQFEAGRKMFGLFSTFGWENGKVTDYFIFVDDETSDYYYVDTEMCVVWKYDFQEMVNCIEA